ncbi:hypothetical protein C475_12280 [Halosimplex carlsbadense 2-9-1]|uniref:Uncharacterized protein n=1 Tax=Halosimplex carlsbadense 2-9-1 TaxID=797114 RepID=M0CMR4_9EURY|nr:hypothetical protein [Halosimplex carlsbadense]ELZ24516.1 hypothetical protein C475_12280 [Halosimplex carlsbadense 2-9-1]
MAESETVTLTLETDEATDELEVPTALIEMLAESEDESPPEVVGDIAMFGLAQRIHSATHHSEGEVSDEVADAEELTLDLFEERFGSSFAELTGHSH